MQLADGREAPTIGLPRGSQDPEEIRTARNITLPDPQSGAWNGTLEQVVDDLVQLNQSTERDFLAIGGKLAEFIQAVSVISVDLAALANREQGVRASEALTHALEGSREMRERYQDGDGGLSDLRGQVVQLKRTLSGFQGTVSTFHTLGVLTRIETARIGNAGTDFGGLADDVKSLAAKVKDGVESALQIADSLIPPIETALQEIAAIEEGQAKDLPALISEVVANLSSFRDIQETANESSARLATNYDSISSAFKRLIVSVQFHDITRQQVEHVIEALGRLRIDPEQADGNVPPDRRGIAAVLALQSSQLADAGAKFAASVASVARSLDDIASNVTQMAGETQTLSGHASGETDSFFLRLEQGWSTLLEGLVRSSDAEAATRAASESLRSTFDRMRGPIQQIQEIEIQMHWMALNARIRASHIGAAGSAIDVLAGAVQKLAFDCKERSELLVEALATMSDAGTRAAGHGPAGSVSEHGGELGTADEMRAAISDLHSSSERSYTQITEIIERGDSLGQDLSLTRKTFSVGALFAEGVSLARASLEDMQRDILSDLAFVVGESSEPDLSDFARHYTMQAERDVHDGVAVTTLAAFASPMVETPDPPGEAASELGDNVEFF